MMKQFLDNTGITIQMVPLHNHTSLSLIDRVIRTLRDLHYNLNNGRVKTITPKDMKLLLEIYNNAPHNTLSKIFGVEVSPNQMNPEMEKYYIRRIQQDNFLLEHTTGYRLKPGMKVYVYNEGAHEENKFQKRRANVKPDLYVVEKVRGSLIEVRNTRNSKEVLILPRFKVNPTYDLK
jgi:hypothetical protein